MCTHICLKNLNVTLVQSYIYIKGTAKYVKAIDIRTIFSSFSSTFLLSEDAVRSETHESG
jgi:hypothetical protein